MMAIFKAKPPLFLILILLALLVAGTGAFLTYRFFQPIGSEGKVELTINPGESVWQIGKKLEEAELIDAASFVLYVRLKNLTTKIQAGRYEIPLTLSPAQLVELLQHGTFDLRLTFLEGWRREQFLEYALSRLPVDDEEFSREFLAETASREGYLFPDTYFVSVDVSAQELVETFTGNFNRWYEFAGASGGESLAAAVSKSGLSKDQVVTIAAMVEREIAPRASAEERQTIAGIIVKRWKAGWLLGVDATVQYALGYNAETKEWWKLKISAADKQVDSPYNTYKYRGLPPGPIANPGLTTLLAAANYNRNTPYWYYLHCPDGKIRYARTLEEQVQNQSCLR